MARLVEWVFKVDWNRDGTYTDESVNLISANGQMRLMAPGEQLTGGRGMIDEAQVLLHNADNRYSPDNTGGPLYDYIKDGGGYQLPAYLAVAIANVGTNESPTYHRLITGVINVPRTQAATVKGGAVATLTIRSRDELLREYKLSTSLRQNYSEADNIRYVLEQCGFTDGVDFVSQDYNGTPALTPTLDGGMQTIPAFLLDDEDALPDLWDLAAACGGWFYCDPDGMFNYANPTRWLDQTAPAYFLDASKWQDYSSGYNDTGLVKTVVVELSPLNELIEDVLWESDDVVVIPPGASKAVAAKLRQPASSVYGMVASVDWRAVSAGGSDMTTNVTIARTVYGQRVDMIISNNSQWRTAFVPRLQLRGIGLDGRPGQTVETTSVHAFWTGRSARKLTASSFYIQTYGQAKFLADFYLGRHERPTLYHSIRGIPGRPAMRLGHQVAISTNEGTRYAHAYEIRWRLDRNGFSQDVELVDRERLYAYANTSPVRPYFKLGVTPLGASGRWFY